MGFNSTLVLGVTLISLVFVVMSGIIFTAGARYGVQVEEEYQDMFDSYEETTELFDTTQQIVQGGDINPDGQADAVFPNSIAAGKQMLASGNLFVAFVNQIPRIISVPAVVVSMLVFIVFVVSVLGFIAFLNDRTP